MGRVRALERWQRVAGALAALGTKGSLSCAAGAEPAQQHGKCSAELPWSPADPCIAMGSWCFSGFLLQH